MADTANTAQLVTELEKAIAVWLAKVSKRGRVVYRKLALTPWLGVEARSTACGSRTCALTT